MTLKAAQVRLLEELLNPAHKSIEGAALAAGVTRRTAYRWLENATFRLALDAAEGQAMDEVARRTLAALRNVERLYLDFVGNEAKDDKIRLTAAAQLADLALRLWEARSLDRRLSDLEKALHETSS